MNGKEDSKEKLDQILIQVGKMIAEDEQGLHIVNTERMRDFMACEKVMKILFNGTGAKVVATPHDMYPSAGTIEITAKKLVIRDTELFTLAAGLASNYEIYPKLDGTIVLAFMFYGLTKKLKE